MHGYSVPLLKIRQSIFEARHIVMFTNHKMANTVQLTSVTLSVDECELTDYGSLIVFQNVLSEAVLRILKLRQRQQIM